MSAVNPIARVKTQIIILPQTLLIGLPYTLCLDSTLLLPLFLIATVSPTIKIF